MKCLVFDLKKVNKKNRPSNEPIRVQKELVQPALHAGKSENKSQFGAKIVRLLIG